MTGLTPSIESTCDPPTSTAPLNKPGRAASNWLVVAPKLFHACAGAAI